MVWCGVCVCRKKSGGMVDWKRGERMEWKIQSRKSKKMLFSLKPLFPFFSLLFQTLFLSWLSPPVPPSTLYRLFNTFQRATYVHIHNKHKPKPTPSPIHFVVFLSCSFSLLSRLSSTTNLWLIITLLWLCTMYQTTFIYYNHDRTHRDIWTKHQMISQIKRKK